MRLIDADDVRYVLNSIEESNVIVTKKDAINFAKIALYEDVRTVNPEILFPDLVDKIASFFEQEENWARLKHRCWLIGDRSDELRELLYDALKDGDSK